MSVQALSCAFAMRGLTASEKLVLLALSNYADASMRCWPSQEKIAADTELSDRTVWGALKSMERRRILSRQARKRSDGTRTTDVFTLHFAGVIEADPLADFANSTRNSCESQSQPLREPLAPVATLTTFEPSVNRQAEPTRVKRASASDFEDWYSGYPHKVGRADAVKAFSKAITKADLGTLKLGLSRYLRTKPSDHNWCNPATWLNQERWLDEPSAGTGIPPSLTQTNRVRATPEGLTDEQLRTLAHQQAAALGRSAPPNPLDS